MAVFTPDTTPDTYMPRIGGLVSTERTLTPLLAMSAGTAWDFDVYAQSFVLGKTPDRFPYGLESLPKGWELRQSNPRFRNGFVEFLRRGLRRIAGADVIGALQRWRSIREADVLYAHTEAEYLGAAFLLIVTRCRRPILVGHTIWLFKAWEAQPWLRRKFLHRLFTRVDLFVYNAEPNRDLGASIIPERIHEYIPFGVSPVFYASGPWTGQGAGAPLILAVGNDQSRDWDVLAQALADLPAAVQVRLATNKSVPRLSHALVQPTTTVAELCSLYRSASCLVVASSPNSHAGGITTILEGAAIGAPIVATDTGGLAAYFDGAEIAFVPVADPERLRERILHVLDDPTAARAMADRARARVQSDGYTNDLYWARVATCITAAGLVERPR